jgi:hypothetical protein
MKPILKYTLIGLLIAVMAGISVAGVAYAQGNGPGVHDSLAELLGLTREELRDQLQNGKTLEELTEAAGIDLDVYREEMRQRNQENLKVRIEEALANGDITQEHADWLMEGLDKGFLGGPFVGFSGRGSGGRPDQDPAGMPRIRGGKPSSDQ